MSSELPTVTIIRLDPDQGDFRALIYDGFNPERAMWIVWISGYGCLHMADEVPYVVHNNVAYFVTQEAAEHAGRRFVELTCP